jgi:adenylate cyclase
MLAVLPFENLGEPEYDYFADGISDEILTKLSTIPQLGVIARESAFKYRGDEKNIAEIGEELSVQYILKGEPWTGSQPRISKPIIISCVARNFFSVHVQEKNDFIQRKNIGTKR